MYNQVLCSELAPLHSVNSVLLCLNGKKEKTDNTKLDL